MEKEEDDYTTSFSPSFSSYTCNRISETVERVRLEFSGESNGGHCEDEFEFVNPQHNDCDFMFPMFDQVLLSAVKSEKTSSAVVNKSRLIELFLLDDEDESNSNSSSSDEEKEMKVEEKAKVWGKSKSTGSMQRWRVKELLKRSYSEGKQSLKFLKWNSRNREEEEEEEEERFTKKEKVSAHEKFYLRKKAKNEEDKRKSFLPYKKHVVGFLFNRVKS